MSQPETAVSLALLLIRCVSPVPDKAFSVQMGGLVADTNAEGTNLISIKNRTYSLVDCHSDRAGC